jgi:hypothetical protein
VISRIRDSDYIIARDDNLPIVCTGDLSSAERPPVDATTTRALYDWARGLECRTLAA